MEAESNPIVPCSSCGVTLPRGDMFGPDDALQFVSNKFLGGLDFGRGVEERKACVNMCQYFHTSTIALSKEVSES